MTVRNGAAEARALMVVGTCSNAGKSVTVAALCRIFARRGYRVAPFKAQNMSLNAGVTPEGHEIARSTCVQAESAGVAPHVDMNPVLLKPEAERRSQVVLAGRPCGHIEAANWQARKDVFWRQITTSLDRLRRRFDLVLFEGAGSPAEINLAAGDVSNLRVAAYARAPALLVGDIDRGGVFASLLGTMMLLEPSQRRLVKGFVINKLRGDPKLLGDGLDMLRERAFGVPTLGVVPFLPDLGLAEEDSVALDSVSFDPPAGNCDVELAVVRFPRISNFDDLDPLMQEPGVHLRWVDRGERLGRPAAVILPGTKSTLADLEWLRSVGLASEIVAAAEAGTGVVGLCGGYQMLGAELADPEGVEAAPGSRAPGLGLLPRRTVFAAEKRTRLARARWLAAPGPLATLAGLEVRGYEIHMGSSEPTAPDSPSLLQLDADGDGVPRQDGCADASGRIWGSYLHGLFDNDGFRHAWLAGLGRAGEGRVFDRQAAYDRLADHFEAHLDLDAIEHMIRAGSGDAP